MARKYYNAGALGRERGRLVVDRRSDDAEAPAADHLLPWERPAAKEDRAA